MLTTSESRSNSSLSQSTEQPKFTKTEPKIPLTSQRKSKLQSLISTQPQKNEKGNSFFFERGQVPLRTYKLFYESPTSNETTEINVQLKEEATVLDFINLAISSLKSNKKNISENYTFTVYFAKKSGIPKNDLPALEQTQLLRECGDSSLLYLKAENPKNSREGKATLCSSSFGNETSCTYRKNSLLENSKGKFNRDVRIKERGFLERVFCCKN